MGLVHTHGWTVPNQKPGDGDCDFPHVDSLKIAGCHIISRVGSDPSLESVLIDRIVKISTDADNKNSSFIDSSGRELMRLGKFFRFSVPQGLEKVTMEELQKDTLMKDLTFAYMRDEFTRVEKCAANLSNKRAGRKQRGSHTSHIS